MNLGLPDSAIDEIQAVLRAHPNVKKAVVFGSRALGRHRDASDVDLALWGPVDLAELGAVLSELEDLPLPWRFDVVAMSLLKDEAVRDHIERVGVTIFAA